MNIKDIIGSLTYNNKKYNFDLELSGYEIKYTAEDLELKLTNDKNLINVSVYNKSDKRICLNSIKLRLMSLTLFKDISCLVTPEVYNENLKLIYINRKDKDKARSSQLFTVIKAQNNDSYLIGFLATHSSKNYVELLKGNKKLYASAVFDFVNHWIEPGGELTLDSIYYDFESYYFEGLQVYMDNIIRSHQYAYKSLNKVNYKKEKRDNLLFEKTASSYTFKIKNRPIRHKLGYPIDISSEEGKKRVVEKALKLKSEETIKVQNINDYLKTVEKNKCCNAYYELNKVLKDIKAKAGEVQFLYDNAPLGLIIGNSAVGSNEFALKVAENILGRFFARKQLCLVDSRFLAGLMMQRLFLKCSTSYYINNSKLKEVLQIITGNASKEMIKYKELNSLIEDIGEGYAVIPYLEKDNVLSLLIDGMECTYIALINLNKAEINIYADVSFYRKYGVIDDVVTEIFSGIDYLVCDGKVFITRFAAMDCIIIKKVKTNDTSIKYVATGES
jgi:hypothetical protein